MGDTKEVLGFFVEEVRANPQLAAVALSLVNFSPGTNEAHNRRRIRALLSAADVPEGTAHWAEFEGRGAEWLDSTYAEATISFLIACGSVAAVVPMPALSVDDLSGLTASAMDNALLVGSPFGAALLRVLSRDCTKEELHAVAFEDNPQLHRVQRILCLGLATHTPRSRALLAFPGSCICKTFPSGNSTRPLARCETAAPSTSAGSTPTR